MTLAMLADEATVAEIDELLASPNWAAERKSDGVRLVIAITPSTGRIDLYNRSGGPLERNKKTTAVRRALEARTWEGLFCFDGELMTDGTAWIWDMPSCQVGTFNIRYTSPYHQRRAALETVAHMLGWDQPGSVIRLVPSTSDPVVKAMWWEQARREGWEGLVLKRLDSRYEPNRNNRPVSRAWLKAKITATVDALVVERRPTSVTLGIGPGGGTIIGDCGAGKANPQVGQVVEVRYLAFNRRLIQPRILRIRHDKTAADTTPLSQLRRRSHA